MGRCFVLLVVSVVGALSAALVLTLMYGSIYRQTRERCMGIWTSAWAVGLAGLVFLVAVRPVAGPGDFVFFYEESTVVAGFLLLQGVCIFFDRTMSRLWLHWMLATIAWAALGIALSLPFLALALPNGLFVATVLFKSGWMFLKSEEPELFGKNFTGLALIVWGAHKLDYPFLVNRAQVAPWGYILASCLALIVAVGILVHFFQKLNLHLCEREESFRLLAENAQDFIFRFRVGAAPKFGYVSPAAESITGYRPEEFYQNPRLLFEIVHPEDRTLVERDFPPRSGCSTAEFQLTRKDGSSIWAEMRAATAGGDKQRPLAVEGIIRDITVQKRTREALSRSEARFRELADFLPEIIFECDVSGHLTFFNRKAQQLFGYGNEELGAGLSIYDLVIPEHRQGLAEYVKEVTTGVETPTGAEYAARTMDGSVFPVLIHSSPIVLEGKPGGIRGVIFNIADRKRTEEQLRFLSMSDPLTGLFNRTYFEQEMRRTECEGPSSVSIIVCDVDGLKLINDTLGHKAGDVLLSTVAGTVKGVFRDSDIVARIGGDEFAVLLPDTPEEIVERAYRRIQESVSEHNERHPELPMSLSIGYATSKKPAQNLNELFKEADDNMYREKIGASREVNPFIVNLLDKSIKDRDKFLNHHTKKVGDIAACMAKKLKLTKEQRKQLALLTRFHDIGKVAVPNAVLFKSDSLTHDEKRDIQRHAEVGYRIAKAVPELEPIADFILKHHEWWDGRGYPLGIKGNEIPLECRIVAMAEAYEVMTSGRPYREPMTGEQALREIRDCAGTQFDPGLVDIFISCTEI